MDLKEFNPRSCNYLFEGLCGNESPLQEVYVYIESSTLNFYDSSGEYVFISSYVAIYGIYNSSSF